MDEPRRAVLDEALFDRGGVMLPDPLADVPEEALLPAPPSFAAVVAAPMQVVLPPLVAPVPDRGFEDSAPATQPFVWPGLSLRSPGETPAEHETPEPAVPPRQPLRLDVNTGVTLAPGDSAALTGEHLRITGADSAFLIDILLLSAPTQGALLRDGFALTGGDVFTQEDVDQGRIRYRHDGAAGDDSFTFATPEGEVPPTEFRLIVLSTHRAPVLTRPGRLWEIQEHCQVADILDQTIHCHEPDAEPGLAVVGVRGRGDWAYSPDSGVTWRPVDDVDPGTALLLAPTYAIRFLPSPGWSGRASLTYRAWDQSSHQPGQRLDLSSLDAAGGATAFSHEVTIAAATIRAANHAPAVEPWRGQPAARDLVGAGLAVVRLDGPGAWQYSFDDGRSWLDFGPVYHGRALLLGPGNRVRFLPRRGAAGKVVLGGRIWDGHDGAAGEFVNLSGHGATGEGTPFSEFVQTTAWRLGGE